MVIQTKNRVIWRLSPWSYLQIEIKGWKQIQAGDTKAIFKLVSRRQTNNAITTKRQKDRQQFKKKLRKQRQNNTNRIKTKVGDHRWSDGVEPASFLHCIWGTWRVVNVWYFKVMSYPKTTRRDLINVSKSIAEIRIEYEASTRKHSHKKVFYRTFCTNMYVFVWSIIAGIQG